MKTRLGLFVFALITLPLMGLYVSGGEWSDLSARALLGDATLTNPPATLLTTIMIAGYIVFVNYLNKIITGNQPFNGQLNFMLWVAAASAAMAWLATYLNVYVASWATQSGNPIMQGLLYTPLFALLAPAVMHTRALIAALPGVLKTLSSHHTFTPPSAAKLAGTLLTVSTATLLAGAAWPTALSLLVWLSTLLLLAGLQLLWAESTVFSELKQGEIGRMICASSAGWLVGNFALFAYQSNGGLILIESVWVRHIGLLIFGLLCIQITDVIAEKYRGKKRTDLYLKKKKFPIPIVVK
jgi:hypothetical protein